jgi:galactokinase
MINLPKRELLTDGRELAVDLAAMHGLSDQAAQRKAELFAKAAISLPGPADEDRQSYVTAFFVPGRIEVLGKHTDYAGGRSMVCTAERGFCLVAWPRDDAEITVTDAACGQSVAFKLDPDLVPRSGHWSNYPMTVARRVAKNFPHARRGADIAFASDLPSAAGMSSSSAMIVAVSLALIQVNRLNILMSRLGYEGWLTRPTTLAGYLACVENGQSYGPLEGDHGVGTFGGSEDHTAILCAEPNQISQYAYCPVEFERMIPVPNGYTFAIGVSGVVAEKTGAALQKYNRASRLASAVAELWRRETGRGDPHLAAALGSHADAAERLKKIVETVRHKEFEPAALSARLEHFVLESGEIIPKAGRALIEGDLRRFGRLVDRSQQAAERLLGNQVPETVYLAAAAQENGAIAASAFGAGFGGSVWAMVETAKAEPFLTAWADAYRRKFPQNAEASSFFTTAAGPAAFRVC